MPLVTESVVRPADQIADSQIEDIYNATREALYASHVRSMGTDGNYLIRALFPADLGEATTGPSSTTSGTAGFQDSKIASQNTPDDTSVALYGLVDSTDGGQNVSQIRITSGQGIRAVWDLFPIIGSDPAVSGSVRCRTMYAMTPIIISRNMNVTIEYFIRPSNPTLTRGVEIALIGLTCEGSGANIQP